MESGEVRPAITLDRMLPGLDGLALITALRKVGVQTRVLMISALSDVDERIRGLLAGGDGYLPKPFAPDEMVARVEVLLRRQHPAARERFDPASAGCAEYGDIGRRAAASRDAKRQVGQGAYATRDEASDAGREPAPDLVANQRRKNRSHTQSLDRSGDGVRCSRAFAGGAVESSGRSSPCRDRAKPQT